MSGICKKGFTLIEILVAIAIIVVMAAIVVPNLKPRKAQDERTAFIAQLNSVLSLAWQNALITHSVHRILFDFKKNKVTVEAAAGDKDSQGEQKFIPLQHSYVQTTLQWPDYLRIKNFFIEGFDEMSRFAGADTGQTWFFIVPDGLTQRVTINLIDTHDLRSNGRQTKIGLVLNPFTAQFTAYDTFKN